jgi:acyl-CoA thioesterase
MPPAPEDLQRFFAKDRFASTNGVELVELRRGFAKAQMKVEERHLNAVGIVQGGAIFTLADFAFAVACNSAGQIAIAVNTNLSFVKATRSGTLYAEAEEIARSRKLSTCAVRVIDDSGELIAVFQGTAYIKEEPLPLSEGEKPTGNGS